MVTGTTMKVSVLQVGGNLLDDLAAQLADVAVRAWDRVLLDQGGGHSSTGRRSREQGRGRALARG